MTRSTLARTLSPTSWMLLIGLPSCRAAPTAVPPCRRPDGSAGPPVTSRNGIGEWRRRCLSQHCTSWAPVGFSTLWAFAGADSFEIRPRSAPGPACAQPRTSVSTPTQSTMSMPIAPMTPRNGSPPTNAAPAMTPNSAASPRAMTASPSRSMSGRLVAGATGAAGSAGSAGSVGDGVASSWSGVVMRAAYRVRGGRRRLRLPVQLEVAGHEVAGQGRGALPSPSAPLDEHGDRDRRALAGREADEPRVRLAAAPELRRAGLARRRHAGDLGARRELLPEVALDRLLHRLLDRLRVGAGEDAAPDRRVDGPRARSLAGDRRDEARRHEHAVVRHGRRYEGHLERRDERLALPERRRRELDVVREPAGGPAAAARHL